MLLVLFTPTLLDERPQGAQVLPLLRADQTKPNPKSGTVQLEWNTTGNLLLVRFGTIFSHVLKFQETQNATYSDNIPAAVHIYDFPSPQEEFVPRLRSVLLHSLPVLNARWNPVRKGSLVLCCGTQSVYIWSDEWVGESGEEEEMAECIGVPARKPGSFPLFRISEFRRLNISSRKIRDTGRQMGTRWQGFHPIRQRSILLRVRGRG